MMINVQHLFPYFGTNAFNLKILIRFTNSSLFYSLGFKDVKIRTLNTSVQGYSNFPCDINYYYNGTTCLPCHSYCSSCYGPTNDQCNSCIYPKYSYQNGSCYDDCPTSGPLGTSNYTSINYCWAKCRSGYYWAFNDSCSPACDAPYKKTTGQNYVNYCSNPCTNSSQYLYPNGSCLSTCSSPLQPDNLAGNGVIVNLCLNPCKAADGTLSFLYPNSSCHANCPSLLSSKYETGVKYCYTPCTGSQYLYPNRTCNAACNAPLVPFEEPNFRYCTNPCQSVDVNGITVIQFLFPNSSCTANCPSHLLSRTEASIKYCSTPCDTTQYFYPNRTCSHTCPSPLVPIEEANGAGFKYCTNPCKAADGTMSFLYPNRTCSADCPSPLSSRTEPDVKYCFTPCQMNEYLYANGNCNATCYPPLIVKEEPSSGFKYCINPCQTGSTGTFLYPNSTCHSDCLSPLLNRTETGIKYCYTPCQSNQYLYADGSCSTCNLPLKRKVEPNTFSFCINPCLYSDSLFLFPDGTCNSACPLPLFNRTAPDGKYCENPCAVNKSFLHENLLICQETCQAPSIQKTGTYANICKFPCENPDHYYHTLEKQCKATCDFPRQAQETPLPKLCISSLSEEEVKQVQQMANAASTAGTAADTGLMVFSVISSSDSTSACMGPLAKMLQYIRFMDIVFPEKVVLMLQEQAKNANKGGFTHKILGSAIDTFPNKKLKGQFYTYKTTSNFFVNFWPSLFNLLVILGGTMLLVGLTRFTKGHHPKTHEILKGLTDVVKWNVFLITFCGSIGDIVLFTALEFQTMELDNSQAVFSFILCLGINALAIFIVRKILYVNSDIRKSTKNTLGDDHKKLIEQKFSSYRALFECYKEYSYYQQIFLFVFILRLAIFNAVIGYIYNSPLFQATVSVILNILMLGYLVTKRPMKKLMNLIQQIILELVLLPFNICVLTLAIMDHKEVVEIDRRKAIGEVIFYINLMIPMLSLALMAAKFIVMGFDLYKSWKLGKVQKAQNNKGKHKGIELTKATQVINNTTEQFSMQQNLNFETSQCKILSENNTQILDLTDNNSTIYPESHMSNSRLSSPVFPKMKIKRTRRYGDPQQNLFALENNDLQTNNSNLHMENNLHTNNDFQLNNNFHMENNFQTSNYYLQPPQVQFSSTTIQQEEFEGQEMYESQEVTMTHSGKMGDNLTREQDIPDYNHQTNFISGENNQNFEAHNNSHLKNNFQRKKNFDMKNNEQISSYYPQQQVPQQEVEGQQMNESQDTMMTRSEKKMNVRKEQDIRERTNSLQYKRASKLSGKIF